MTQINLILKIVPLWLKKQFYVRPPVKVESFAVLLFDLNQTKTCTECFKFHLSWGEFNFSKMLQISKIPMIAVFVVMYSMNKCRNKILKIKRFMCLLRSRSKEKTLQSGVFWSNLLKHLSYFPWKTLAYHFVVFVKVTVSLTVY